MHILLNSNMINLETYFWNDFFAKLVLDDIIKIESVKNVLIDIKIMTITVIKDIMLRPAVFVSKKKGAVHLHKQSYVSRRVQKRAKHFQVEICRTPSEEEQRELVG